MKENKSLVIAELINKAARKTKNHETFYILEISIKRTLTEMVLELRKEESSTTLHKEPFYVFTNENRNRFAHTLEKGCIYAFWFVKTPNLGTQETYFHVKDWRKLSTDKRSIERTLRLVLGRKEVEEEVITNRELLIDLKKRLKEGKISFSLSPVKSDTLFEIDTDLKDNESNFRINLQDENSAQEE